jgi:hypothetical protein
VRGTNYAPPWRFAALLHWFDEEILAFLLEPPLRAEAEALAALLRRLSLVETLPARGPGATNVLETARLTLRARVKTDSPERFAALSVRAQACFAVTGEAPHLRVESLTIDSLPSRRQRSGNAQRSTMSGTTQDGTNS